MFLSLDQFSGTAQALLETQNR